jgi:hypothetical protein
VPQSDINYAVTVYDLIADLRRKHPTPAATETLDSVVAELGKTRDNLKSAVANVQSRPVAPGGKPVLDELVARAREAGIDDLDYGPDPYARPRAEPLDEATGGIGALLAISSIAAVGLAILAVIAGINAILSASSG